jgi:hypothetical protein
MEAALAEKKGFHFRQADHGALTSKKGKVKRQNALQPAVNQRNIPTSVNSNLLNPG